jgi:membrane associated rhomboid family serine protease
MLFLLVFGSRVNALIGNLWMLGLYPLFAIISSLAQGVAMAGGPLTPTLGASGAVMGLAGMYLVLFPVHRVHMALWLRWGLIGGFHLSLKSFAVRGFWVVLFYIALDVIYTVLRFEDDIAHWAHLGGFIAGAATAATLLFARLINARGGDLFSVILGRRAWALVGRPRLMR